MSNGRPVRTLAAGLLAALAACGGHRHGAPMSPGPNKLAVEISAGGSHEDALRAGASAGLLAVPFAVPVDDRGEVELQVDVAGLEAAGAETVCKVKILVVRLPHHSLIGIADGSARARGDHDDAKDACIEQLGTALIRGKVRALLSQVMRAKT